MDIQLAYGKSGLTLNTDPYWNVDVVKPHFLPGLENPLASLRASLQSPIESSPLTDCVKGDHKVGIIVNDITRATPSPIILQAILAELPYLPPENITIFVALGTHRPNTDAELRTMLGEDIVTNYRIVQNNAFDPDSQVKIGVTRSGNQVFINRHLMDCPVKILTGFIEPHFFAGFSGGGKAIMPGMAGLDTILRNHCAANIAHPSVIWGITDGNPLYDEICEVAEMAGGAFLLNVTLNNQQAITGVFAGDLVAAHTRGCQFTKESAMVPVEKPYDIVVTTNSGYPLDLNLYQTVKGISAAAQIVRPGGTIVAVSECWDGIPDHGLYKQLLQEGGSPREVLDRINTPGFLKHDQWQAQVQAQIQLKADVFIHSGGLTNDQIRAAMLKPAPSLEKTLAQLVKKYGPKSRICVLPEGPVTIPYIL